MTTVNLFRDRLTVHPIEVGARRVRLLPLDLVRTKLQTIDADLHKGAVDYEQPSAVTNARGLDEDRRPNDATAIALDAIGASADQSQR